MYPSHIFTIFKKIQNLWSCAIGGSPLNSSNLSLCPPIWNSHFILVAKFLRFLMTILETKIFFKLQKSFLHLLKSVNNKHTLFELVSRRNMHHHPPRERLHFGGETWLSIMGRTSASSKMQSQSKSKKNENTKKGSLR